MNELILVVEDTPDSQILAKKILQHAGYNVLIAENAKSAIKLCEQITPNIILMDISLPDMSGKELTLVLRKEQRLANIPIIAATAHAYEQEKEEIIKVGMNGFLTKPFTPKQLIDKVGEFL